MKLLAFVRRRWVECVFLLLVLVVTVANALSSYWGRKLFNPPFQGTPSEVLAPIASALQVKPGGRYIDPGCGAGDVAVVLAVRFDAFFDCVDFDARLIELAGHRVERLGVAPLVQVLHADALELDFSAYDGVYLFMSAVFNERILPRLLASMKPGARVVSLSHSSKSYPPTYTVTHSTAERDYFLHVWIVPDRVRVEVAAK